MERLKVIHGFTEEVNGEEVTRHVGDEITVSNERAETLKAIVVAGANADGTDGKLVRKLPDQASAPATQPAKVEEKGDGK